MISDIIIGMSDGLTVPFALAAGLAGTSAQSNVVLVGGLTELAAGGILRGLGGYLVALQPSGYLSGRTPAVTHPF